MGESEFPLHGEDLIIRHVDHEKDERGIAPLGLSCGYWSYLLTLFSMTSSLPVESQCDEDRHDGDQDDEDAE